MEQIDIEHGGELPPRSSATKDKQKVRAEAWRTFSIHLEVCGCGRGDRRCSQGSDLRDMAIVADALAEDGVHNTPHQYSCACPFCVKERNLRKTQNRRTTPEKISELGPDDVFTFGSNSEGVHGKGAAKLAKERFGAVVGKGFGHYGQSYAIPTREFGNDGKLFTLSLDDIAFNVRRFLSYAKICPELTFYVTKIGCGLAGYRVDQIAPMFAPARTMPNVVLPAEFFKP